MATKTIGFINKSRLKMEFAKEFLAYNISTHGLSKKIYIRPVVNKSIDDIELINLKDEQLSLISNALKNPFMSKYKSDRYCLYDLSLRSNSLNKTLGFCFNDSKDYSYIEPFQIFEMFKSFGIKSFVKNIMTLQKSIFHEQPIYNPIFMIGMVVDQSKLKCIKAYIRYDINELPIQNERLKMLYRVLDKMNSKIEDDASILNIATELEDLGFVFSFVGIDCNENHEMRYKFYFRAYSNIRLAKIELKIRLIFKRLNFYNSVDEMFNLHENNMWGVAISSNSLMDVNGIQFYFYP